MRYNYAQGSHKNKNKIVEVRISQFTVNMANRSFSNEALIYDIIKNPEELKESRFLVLIHGDGEKLLFLTETMCIRKSVEGIVHVTDSIGYYDFNHSTLRKYIHVNLLSTIVNLHRYIENLKEFLSLCKNPYEDREQKKSLNKEWGELKKIINNDFTDNIDW
jgi:hypothetical protein